MTCNNKIQHGLVSLTNVSAAVTHSVMLYAECVNGNGESNREELLGKNAD